MRSRARSDRGQATVELALCIPLVCLMLMTVVQVALVVRDQLTVQLAAREAARAAAVSADPARAASAAAHGATGIEPSAVRTAHGDGVVTVTVEAVSHTDVPLIGVLVPDVTLRASAAMAVEPP